MRSAGLLKLEWVNSIRFSEYVDLRNLHKFLVTLVLRWCSIVRVSVLAPLSCPGHLKLALISTSNVPDSDVVFERTRVRLSVQP